MTRTAAAFFIFLVSAPLCYSAQAETPPEVLTCREESDLTRQIDCLEAAIAALKADRAFASNAASERDDEISELGAEQVSDRPAKRAKSDRRVNAAIAEASYTLRDRLVVFLDNGQVWRQTGGGRLRLSKSRDYTVTIGKGAISGYKMTVNEKNRSVPVERLK